MKCESCGGENSATATRCEYCDQPLRTEKVLEVAWSARTQEGTTGEGRIRVQAPAKEEAERLRAIAEAAFSASVDELGTSASAAQIQEAMQRRMGSLLPRDHHLLELQVTSFKAFILVGKEVASQRAQPGPLQATAQRSGLSVLLPAGLGAILLMSGALCIVMGFVKSGEATHIKTAKVVPAAEAGSAQGLVCVEKTVPEVSEPLVVPGSDVRCVYLVETVTRRVTEEVRTTRSDGSENVRTKERTQSETSRKVVESFRLGTLEVRPTVEAQATGFTLKAPLEKFPARKDGDLSYEYEGLSVEEPLTVVGVVQGGIMSKGGAVFAISTEPSRGALVSALRSDATMGWVCGGIGLVTGLLLLLGTLAAFLRRR